MLTGVLVKSVSGLPPGAQTLPQGTELPSACLLRSKLNSFVLHCDLSIGIEVARGVRIPDRVCDHNVHTNGRHEYSKDQPIDERYIGSLLVLCALNERR
jgi:hypothetical protein